MPEGDTLVTTVDFVDSDRLIWRFDHAITNTGLSLAALEARRPGGTWSSPVVNLGFGADYVTAGYSPGDLEPGGEWRILTVPLNPTAVPAIGAPQNGVTVE